MMRTLKIREVGGEGASGSAGTLRESGMMKSLF